jgi:hypothetical protein
MEPGWAWNISMDRYGLKPLVLVQQVEYGLYFIMIFNPSDYNNIVYLIKTGRTKVLVL